MLKFYEVSAEEQYVANSVTCSADQVVMHCHVKVLRVENQLS